MITAHDRDITLATLMQLTVDELSAHHFENAVVYRNAVHLLERSGTPEAGAVVSAQLPGDGPNALGVSDTVKQRIRLTRLPGNRVTTDDFTFSIADARRLGGKERIMHATKEALIFQFKLRPDDVSITETICPADPNLVNFRCLAYLSGNKEPRTEREAREFYQVGQLPRLAPPEIPDFIDV